MRATNTTHIPGLKNTLLLILQGCFIAGLLSYLYTPIKVSVALSIIISALIFGLNKYYLFPQSNIEQTRNFQRRNP
jgi:membrane associated rhomboid family serine protease